jgi:F420H(2)-dependent quinone reductase
MKHAVHLVQTFVVNPLVKLGFDVGISAPGDALLATTGRTTGRPRRTPVCDCEEGDTFWLIAQTGRDAEFVRNPRPTRVCASSCAGARGCVGEPERRTSWTTTTPASVGESSVKATSGVDSVCLRRARLPRAR